MKSCWNCKQEVAEGSSNCPHCRVSLSESAVNMMATVGPGMAPSVQIVVGVVVNNRYEIRREIGRGGMGIVYLAFDRMLEREVAIKVIPQELCMDPRAVAELKRETGIAIDLTHANIVRLHTLDTWEGQAYVVMEYVGGGTLAHILAKGVLSVEGALPILRQLAAALDYSHSAASAVIHRDLKPLNILLAEDGVTVKVADFGLARVLRDSASRISGHDSAGTLAYMAPEQIRGKGVGRETDIYSFAAIVYEMLSGRPPFYTGDLRWQILHEDVEPIEGLPAHVNAALQRGLAKDRAERPGTAGELLAMLVDEKLQGSGSKRRLGVKKPAATASGKSRGVGRPVLAVFIAIFITCLVGLGFAGWKYFYFYDDVRLQQVNADFTKPKTTSDFTPPATVVLKEEIKGGRLTVQTSPAEATVRLLNIAPAYSPGMALDAGRYHVEVTAPGYERDARWVELAAGDDMIVDFSLTRERAIVAAPVQDTQQPFGSDFTDPTTGMEFVAVPGGCFQMGDTFGDGHSREKPVHEVCVDSFFLGKYEVTQGEYQKIIGTNPSGFKKGDRYPVENVSWDEAQEFINKLNSQSKRQYRLPTEAEWEYAARSGGKKERYAGGNDIDAVAWYYNNSGSSTHQVGGKKPNGLGLYDMSGNVYEWTGDWYGNYYASSPRQNPAGPSSGSERVPRGGGWKNGPDVVRAAYRILIQPWLRSDNLGFRLVFAPRTAER